MVKKSKPNAIECYALELVSLVRAQCEKKISNPCTLLLYFSRYRKIKYCYNIKKIETHRNIY